MEFELGLGYGGFRVSVVDHNFGRELFHACNNNALTTNDDAMDKVAMMSEAG